MICQESFQLILKAAVKNSFPGKIGEIRQHSILMGGKRRFA